MDFVFLIWLSGQTRRKLPVPMWIPLVAVAVVVVSVAAIGTHNQMKKFWDEIRGDWLAHERMLAEDPRNGAGV